MPNDKPDQPGVIHVEFLDHATGAAFAESRVPIAQLPESFEARTTMHLGESDWDIVEARPMTAAEFRRSGKLTLILNKVVIQQIDPHNVLFSLPTITGDALPPIADGTSKLGTDIVEIHEDDWRQIEWVSASQADAVAAELEAIRQIYQKERTASGFKNLHVRRAVPVPLVGRSFRLDDLNSVIGPQAVRLAGIGYCGVAGIVASSFAFRLMSSIELYGVAPGGIVEAVCFANMRTNNMPQPDVRNLAAFAATHDLLLADWCALAILQPTEQDYAAYFDRS